MTKEQPEEVRQLVEAVDALLAIEDDAECAEAISEALKQWQETGSKLREARQVRVKRLKDQGKTWQELGDLMGVHYTRAAQIGSGVNGRTREKAKREAAAKEAADGQPEK
ncbi:hypothetical protein [Streptomyces griseus]|uniref:hypothetical protein n=1 Tax=Streptomyces griseus TaxID=1911 RepID=UPI001ABF613A|nr:hypothetical protein [Streptomyces fimicarius]